MEGEDVHIVFRLEEEEEEATFLVSTGLAVDENEDERETGEEGT